jgi:hypothetical protein
MARSLYHFHFRSHGGVNADEISLFSHSKFSIYFVSYSGGPPKKIHAVSGPRFGTPGLDNRLSLPDTPV